MVPLLCVRLLVRTAASCHPGAKERGKCPCISDGKSQHRTLQQQIMFIELIWLAQAHWTDIERTYKLSNFQIYGGWAAKFSSFILFPKYIHLSQIRNFGVLGWQMDCYLHNFSRLEQTFSSLNPSLTRFNSLLVFFLLLLSFLVVCLFSSSSSILLTKWNPLHYNKLPSSSDLTVTNILNSHSLVVRALGVVWLGVLSQGLSWSCSKVLAKASGIWRLGCL